MTGRAIPPQRAPDPGPPVAPAWARPGARLAPPAAPSWVRPGTRDARRDRGQATVELALALPLLCLLLFAVVQAAVVGRDQLAVQLAAREAARAAAVAADPVAAGTTAAHRAIALRPLTVQIISAGTTVTAIVRYTQHTDVPLVGSVVPDVVLHASVTMAFEPP